MEKYLNKSNKRIYEEVNTTEDISENIDTNDYVAGSSKSSENEIESFKIQNYLLDGKYYKMLSVEGTKISAVCQLCTKKIIAYSNSTGNLLSHLKVSNIYYFTVRSIL